MIKFKPLQKKTIDWAIAAGFYNETTLHKQWTKLQEETNELEDAISDSNESAIRDAIGDTLVCMFIRAGLLRIELKYQSHHQRPAPEEKLISNILANTLFIENQAVPSQNKPVMQIIVRDLDAIAKLHNTTLLVCWEEAYEVINSRIADGTVVNGIFYKAGDTSYET